MSIIQNLAAADYHGNPDFTTNSKLKDLDRGPAFYYLNNVAKVIERKVTEAMVFGSAFDDRIFTYRDEASWLEHYAIIPPEANMRTKVWQEWEAAQVAAGKGVLSQKELLVHDNMLMSIAGNKNAMELLDGAETQVTLTHYAEGLDLTLAGRPDALNHRLGCVVDLKTTADMDDWWDYRDPQSPRNGAPVYKFGYHRQGAFYQKLLAQNGLTLPHFKLIVVEKVLPYRCEVFEIDPMYLDIGWNAVRRDLNIVSACKRLDFWPNGSSEILPLAPAAWMDVKESREDDSGPSTLV